ncbi:MAG TPA: hypothetical protein VIV11_21580 [Kofleriaceae bacterium]
MIARWAVLAIVCVPATVAHADEKSPPIAARPADSSEPYWFTYAAFRNDVFTELDPPIDDFGFTHDNVFVLRRQQGIYTFGGSFMHRWITSRMDRRRWDLVELFATGERELVVWTDAAERPHRVSATVRVGPTLGGNFGGRYMQNGWHEISETGPTVYEGLANDYPGDRKLGFVIGSRVRASVGDRLQGYGFVDGQVALGGTGVTAMQAALGGNAASKYLGVHLELGLTRYHVGDPYLALPGGYRPGFQLEWRLGVDVHWSRFRIGYEYRANESGSGEPMGVFELSTTR